MAKQFTAKIHFGAVDGVTKTLNKIAGNVNRTAGQIQRRFSSLGSGFTGGALAASPVSFGAGLFGRQILQDTVELEKSLTEVAALAGKFTDSPEMKALQNQAIDLSSLLPFSPTEITQAAAEYKRAGATLNEVQNNLKGILEGAAVSGLDPAAQADFSTNTAMSMFGKVSAENLQRINDNVSALATNTNSTAADIFAAFKNAAPVAATVGIELEQLGGYLSALSFQGFKAGEAGRGLRTIFMRLAAPTKQAAQTLDRLGMSLNNYRTKVKQVSKEGAEAAMRAAGLSGSDAAPQVANILNSGTGTAEQRLDAAIAEIKKIRDLSSEAEQQLRQALRRETGGGIDMDRFIDDLSNRFKAGDISLQDAKNLVGVEQGAKLIALLKSADREQIEEILRNSEGATAELNERLSKSLSRRLESISSLFQGITSTIGMSQGGAFGSMLDTIRDALQGFLGVLRDSPAIAGGVAIMTAAFTALAPTLATLGLAANGIATLISPLRALAVMPFKTIAAGVALIGKGFSVGGLLGFAGALTAIAAAGAGLYALFGSDLGKISKAFGDSFGKHMPFAMSKFGSAFKYLLAGDLSAAMYQFKAGLANLGKVFSDTWAAIRLEIDKLAQANPSFGKWVSAIENLGGAFREVWNAFREGESTGEGIKSLGQAIREGGFEAAAVIINGVAAARRAVAAGYRDAIEAYTGFQETTSKGGGLFDALGASFKKLSAEGAAGLGIIGFVLFRIARRLGIIRVATTAIKAGWMAIRGAIVAAGTALKGFAKISRILRGASTPAGGRGKSGAAAARDNFKRAGKGLEKSPKAPASLRAPKAPSAADYIGKTPSKSWGRLKGVGKMFGAVAGFKGLALLESLDQLITRIGADFTGGPGSSAEILKGIQERTAANENESPTPWMKPFNVLGEAEERLGSNGPGAESSLRNSLDTLSSSTIDQGAKLEELKAKTEQQTAEIQSLKQYLSYLPAIATNTGAIPGAMANMGGGTKSGTQTIAAPPSRLDTGPSMP
ncbi:MAG: phage tail tape measure protein [Pseudomonadota bacterium]|nr:phage tail tape measure protein [Pseudomonadota bacterium]